MVLFTCGACEREDGLDKLVLKSDCIEQIKRSGMGKLRADMVRPRNDPTTTKHARCFAQAAFNELDEHGCLIYANHICKSCVRQLPQKQKVAQSLSMSRLSLFGDAITPLNLFAGDDDSDTDNDNETDNIRSFNSGTSSTTTTTATSTSVTDDSSMVPKLALVNGYFRGAAPTVLTRLNRTELSMICLIDVVTRVSMLTPGSHWGSSATVFSIMNDVNVVLQSLPGNPTINQFAILRGAGDWSPKDFRYSPYFVMSALQWLEDNNHLFDGKIEVPENSPLWLNGGDQHEQERPYIATSLEDYEGITHLATQTDGSVANPGALSTATDSTDVLLESPSDEQSDVLQQVRAIVTTSTNISSGGTVPTTQVHTRERGEYVADYTTDFFIQMAFVHLYPYGRGGPDSSHNIVFNAAYISHMLHLGGFRGFQKSPTFIFYAYTWKMRNKIGTISYLASRSATGEQDTLTVEDAQAFFAHVTANPRNPASGGGGNKIMTEAEIRKFCCY
jgi:hypothetical protein